MKFKSDAERQNYYVGLENQAKVLTTPEQVSATNVISKYHFELIISLAAYVRSKGAELVLVRPPLLGYFPVHEVVHAKHAAWCHNVPLYVDFGWARNTRNYLSQ